MINPFRSAIIIAALIFCTTAYSQLPLHFEQNIAPTYQEAIDMYQSLALKYPSARMVTAGSTDIGKPLQLFIISKSGVFDPVKLRKSGKLVLLINNAIHPGECDGVDACLKLSEEMLKNPSKYAAVLDKCVIAIIPVYNIGGYLNRSAYNRANQNGPAEEGFRGNARNIDLNRDMVKTDTENARSLNRLFHLWNPDILVDTHVSDGADYTYTMTLIPNLHCKLHPAMEAFLNDEMLPKLYKAMADAGNEMIPYVEFRGENPESGLVGFLDLPRYVSGYATLFNTYAFVTETHMLKPYKARVIATYQFLQSLFTFAADHAREIKESRQKALDAALTQSSFVLHWEMDTTRYDSLTFRGYTARHKPSLVSGLDRMFYDECSPWEKKIRYYNYFNPVLKVNKPRYYLVPEAWPEVVERLQNNGIRMIRLAHDTSMDVEAYYIISYKTSPAPFNGRYMHSQVEVRSENQHLSFYKGDYLVETNQVGNDYIVQVLDPRGDDSFFAWGFFDSVLSRKEYFSDYIFEDTAEKLLQASPDLKRKLEEKMQQDSSMRKSAYRQLNFIYEHSPWAEKTWNRYPVFRIN